MSATSDKRDMAPVALRGNEVAPDEQSVLEVSHESPQHQNGINGHIIQSTPIMNVVHVDLLGDGMKKPLTAHTVTDLKVVEEPHFEKGAYRGSTVSFHDVHYEVMVKGGGPCKSKPKKILEGVSGIFKPGTMNAIMGPTGCGKSSLLDILAARKNPDGLSGLVLIDGQLQPPNFKLMSGYVVQDDIVMGTLSVRENLMFSASLRLPSSLKNKEKASRVDRVIEELGLDKCADTKVGNEFFRGVSGGERKRTNIGMELVTSPGVLFLDEPTTGLDSNTAKSVMTLLRRLAEAGSTIIFSIHQPRFSIYKLCDTLHLLGNGETIYFGPAMQGMDFFKTLGYTIEEHDNPADFYLDVINSNETPSAMLPPYEGHVIKPATRSLLGGIQVIDMEDKANAGNDDRLGQDGASVVNNAEKEGPSKGRTRMFAQLFTGSSWNQRLQPELQSIMESYSKTLASGGHTLDPKLKNLSYHTSFFVQFGIVCGRTLKNVLRNPRTSYLQVFTMCLFAVITGAVYVGIDLSCDSGVQNRVGAFFFMAMNMVFGNLSAVDLFIMERALFIHENVSGFYRVSSYFMSKIVCDVIPNRTIPTLFFSLISYWMIGFDPDAGKFFFFFLTLMMTSFVASALSFVISASVRQNAIASLLIGLCYVIMMVFSGLLVNIKTMGDWLKWLQWFSIFRYSLRALSINEFKDKNFYMVVNGTHVDAPSCSGNSYLTKQEIPYDTLWDMWQNIVAMVVMSVILLILTYVQLRRVNKQK